MTTIPTPKGNLILVEVPQEAENFNLLSNQLQYTMDYENGSTIGDVSIPENDYEFIGTIENGVPDFDVSGLVDSVTPNGQLHKQYRDYVHKCFTPMKSFTSQDSFRSLLKSHKIQLDKKYVCLNEIIK